MGGRRGKGGGGGRHDGGWCRAWHAGAFATVLCALLSHHFALSCTRYLIHSRYLTTCIIFYRQVRQAEEEKEEEKPGIGATMTCEEIVKVLIGQVGSVDCAGLARSFLCLRWAMRRGAVNHATRVSFSISRLLITWREHGRNSRRNSRAMGKLKGISRGL